MGETSRTATYATKLRAQGLWVLNVPGGPDVPAGVPDLLVCVDGRFIAIEMKSAIGRTTRMQEYQLQKIRDAGGTAVVCRTWKDVQDATQSREEEAGTEGLES